MTRAEIKTELRNAGIYFKANLLKEDLEKIYNKNLGPEGKLIVHRRPAPVQPIIQPPVETPNPEEELVDPDGNPIINPEPVDPAGQDFYKDLMGKIESAEIPPYERPIEQPLFETTKRKKKKGESSADSFRIEGYVLMLVIDTVFPFAFATVNNMLDKRIKIQAHQLSLNESDFKKLEPLADQAADFLAVNLNPVAGFFLIATFMYGSNLLNIRMQLDIKR